jgi:ubiquinone/menaquinone biosynthesis C-methylase UbiE
MEEIKLNLGCASRPLEGYVNIDLDTREQMLERYPNIDIPEIEIYQYDIFNLPYEDNTITEIKCESMLEHLSFKEEKLIFNEVKRVLKTGGKFVFSVPDFEDDIKKWINAEEDWRDFYRDDEEAIKQCHWFGHYSYSTDSRWGYLIASIFGPQNSSGQFHKNAYTEGKIKSICKYLDFKEPDITRFNWKGDRNVMLKVIAEK